MNRLLTSSLLAVLVIAAGCGGSSGDPDADPAALVPANAPVYVEASLDPGDDVTEVARKLTGSDDPAGELERLVERELNEGGPDFSWEKDLEPALGDRIGVFVTSLSASRSGANAEGGFVAALEDADKAQELLDRNLEGRDADEKAPRIAEKTYRDVEYKVDTANDEAYAIVDEFAAAGSERAVRAAIDAAEGDALADAGSYKQARDQVSDDGVAFAYLRTSALVSALGPQGAALRPLLGQTGETIGIALDAEDDALRVETASLGVRGAAGKGGPGSVLGTLPGDAWLAAGLADVGGSIEQALQQFGQLGAFAGLDLEQILGQVEQQTGIDVRQDLLAWMGDLGVFVRGDSVSDIGGALVIESSDPARTARVIPRLARFAALAGEARVSSLSRPGVDEGATLRFEQVPLPIHIAAAGDRFILAVTDSALDAALSPDQPLSETPAFREASSQLGSGIKPSLFVDLAPVRTLLGEAGVLQDESGREVGEALARLTTVAAGGKHEDDIARGRLVVGVK